MTPRDKAVQTAETMALDTGRSVRSIARDLQDVALRALDERTAQRLALVDREFDRAASGLERDLSAAAASGPRKRRLTPLPDTFGMLAAGFGAASAMGAGRVAPSTPVSELPIVGPTVLVCASIAAVAILTGAVVARRESSTSSPRAVMLWLTLIWSAIAAVAMFVRFATEGVTAVAIAGSVAMVAVAILSLLLALGAQRRAGTHSEPDEPTPAGARLRNELISAGENAQDSAHAALAELDENQRETFAEAYAAGIAAVIARRALPAPTVKRLRTLDWAAARYDVSS